MRKINGILLGVVLSLFVVSLSAQTGAGRIYLGGSSDISFSASTIKAKSDDATRTLGKQTDFSLSPEAGYFIMDGLVVGLGFEISMSMQKPDGSDYKYSSTSMIVGPFVKYYYGAGNIKPFAQATIGFGSMIDKDTYDGDTEKEKAGMFGYGFAVGAAMFMNDNVAFEMGIGYQSGSIKDKEDNPNDVRQVSSGIGVNIGIAIIL